jgi:hypothetical protein
MTTRNVSKRASRGFWTTGAHDGQTRPFPRTTTQPDATSRLRSFAALGLATLLSLSCVGRADALFHIAVIDELMSGLSGSDSVQFVEIRMLAGSQNIVSGSKLSAFDASGTFLRVVLTVPANVTGGANRAWIMGSTDFAAAAGITPDFVFTSTGGLGLETTDGMACWGKPTDQTNPNQYVDCVAYGNYVGPANAHTSAPASITPFGHALVRVSETDNNALDFACNDPADPENNAMAVGSIAASDPCPVCGDNSQQTGEQCDGTDDTACPGLCQLDCTCGNDCGNDTVESAEQCDGLDDTACPGLCQVNCVCGPAGPFDSDEQKCAYGVVGKASVKTIRVYGKETANCVNSLTAGKTVDAPAACVTADGRGKVLKQQMKEHATIEGSCPASGLAYAIDCPAPCDSTDAAGTSEAVDDREELEDCIACLDRSVSITPSGAGGSNGAVLDGVTFALGTVDPVLAKCQSKVVKSHEKLFATRLKEAAGCYRAELKAEATPPLGATCIGADPKGKVLKAISKLEKATTKCTPPAPFDAAECTGLDGIALADCLARASKCYACIWGNVVFASSEDCDTHDNGVTDASCP